MTSEETLAEVLARKAGPAIGRIFEGLHGLRAVQWLLLFIVVAGFGCRYLSADYGLPYTYDWDEPEIVQSSMQILRHGTYGPVRSGRIGYGPLNSAVYSAWAAINYLRGAGKGLFADGIWSIKTERETGYYWTMPSEFLWKQQRVFSALLGTLSILLIYGAGNLLGGRLVGVGAAAVMAFGNAQITASSLITPDSPAVAAMCGCCLASAMLLRNGTIGNYLAAFATAAIAAGFKLNYAMTLALPVFAHVLRYRNTAQPFWTGRFAGGGVLYLALVMVFFSHAILYPTLFLHNYGKEAQIHIPPPDSPRGLFVAMVAYFKKALVALDAGRFGSSNTYGGSVTFDLASAGFPLIATSMLGVAYAWLRDRTSALLLLGASLAGMAMVGSTLQFFFSRHMLPVIPIAALWVGFGLAGTWEVLKWITNTKIDSALQRSFMVVLGIIIFLPVTVKAGRDTWQKRSFPEPRKDMAKYLAELVPEGTSIMICPETRWHIDSQQRQKFKFSQSALPRLLAHPPDSSIRYILAPTGANLNAGSDPGSTVCQAAINQWLASQKVVKEFAGTTATQTVPPIGFGVKLVENRPGGALLLENAIYGTMFDGGTSLDAGATLANGPCAVKSGNPVHARVRIGYKTSRIRLRGRGTAPLQQTKPPTVSIELAPVAEKTFAKPAAKAGFELTRSQGGIADYSADASLAPGDYNVRLIVSDVDNRPVLVAGIAFE